MRRFLLLVLLSLLGFYVGWPAFSAYQIRQGLAEGDRERLANKIDFDRVRASLRPAVEREAETAFSSAIEKVGPTLGQVASRLKDKAMPAVVDRVLAILVTPEGMVRIVRDGGNLARSIKRMVNEQTNTPGGLGGAVSDILGRGDLLGRKPDEAVAVPSEVIDKDAADRDRAWAARPRYGIANIKRLGFDGPLGIHIGVARDVAATEPDLTAHLAFTGFDWKVVGLTPRNRQER